MKTQITLAVLASVSLLLAAMLATPAMTSPVFAGGYDDDDDDNGHDNGDNGDNGDHNGDKPKKCKEQSEKNEDKNKKENGCGWHGDKKKDY